MRINVYQEELDGQEIEIITTVSRNGETFWGLRFWLASPQALIDHSTPEDNDLNAVTLWFRTNLELRGYVARAYGASLRPPC